ncbi:MAG: hypothetical protein M3Q65_22715 [Chloroflexota bacterium]|nr:hypothetical protein [Chloroflexota bacterium]
MIAQDVVDGPVAPIGESGIKLVGLDRGMSLQALLCRPSGGVSFADALLRAAARSAGIGVSYSFDNRFPDDGIEVRRTL